MNTEDVARERVLIVSGVPLIRRGVSSLITESGRYEICGEALNAHTARMLCENEKPDLIVQHAYPVLGEAMLLLRDFARLHRRARTLVIAPTEDAAIIQRMFSAGARGYIRFDDGDVLAALDALAAGEVFLDAHVQRTLVRDFVSGELRTRTSAIDRLTPRELCVFELIARGHDTRSIAAKMCISTKTVETHRGKIQRKLRLRRRCELPLRAQQWLNGDAMRMRLAGIHEATPQQ